MAQTSLPTGLFFFSDARTCKSWLREIPLTNIAQAQQSILDALRMLNRTPSFVPLDRLTCMELLRDKVAYLLGEQRSRYASKTIPLSTGDYAAWNISRQLVMEMEAGYRICWAQANGADAPLQSYCALLIQRTMRYIGLQMLIAGLVYRQFDPALWTRLHLLWSEAESRNLTTKRVKDSVGTADTYSSITQAYTAVLLGQLARTTELTPRQIDFVDAVLKRFGHKVVVTREAVANPQGMICTVDLLFSEGCHYTASLEPSDAIRVLDLQGVSQSLRRRIKKLAAGEEPGSLDLPPDWGREEAEAQLIRLHRLWCEGKEARPVATQPEETEAILSFGIAETHFFLYGDFFEQPGVKRELTRQEMNDIAIFGKVAESTIRARYADFNYGTETWGVVDEVRGQFRLLRPGNSARGVAIGKLLGVKIGRQGAFYLGVIREIQDDPEGTIVITVELLPGKPEAVAVRAADSAARTNANYVQGFRLPPNEALKTPEALIVPPGLAAKDRAIDIYHPTHGVPKKVMTAG
ncbi:MAG: hypothetical protein JNM52_10485, partial [Betaproteobacteria bacterium]|nr:hypothetical protein [Betaproteobacteria bacterium]